MNLRFRCRCGKTLRISQKLAGRKIVCPGCQKKFVIPPEKFNAASEKKPTAPKSPKPAATVSPIDDLESLMRNDRPEERPFDPPIVQPIEPDAAELNYIEDPLVTDKKRKLRIDVVSGPGRPYWKDVLVAFIYPVKNLNNAITFGFIAGIYCLNLFLGFACCLGCIGSIIIFGWISAMMFSVIAETASGSDDLPDVMMKDGIVEDLIKPAFHYIGSFAFALGPATVYSIFLAFDLLPDAMSSGWILTGWLAFGIFLWPMFLQMFAFNALGYLLRIDKIITTIFRTILAYLATWVLLLLTKIDLLLDLVDLLYLRFGVANPLPTTPSFSISIGLFQLILTIYLEIVAMRMIGLYYLHFKNRFTFQLE